MDFTVWSWKGYVWGKKEKKTIIIITVLCYYSWVIMFFFSVLKINYYNLNYNNMYWRVNYFSWKENIINNSVKNKRNDRYKIIKIIIK